jgi:hypothetical protein
LPLQLVLVAGSIQRCSILNADNGPPSPLELLLDALLLSFDKVRSIRSHVEQKDEETIATLRKNEHQPGVPSVYSPRSQPQPRLFLSLQPAANYTDPVRDSQYLLSKTSRQREKKQNAAKLSRARARICEHELKQRLDEQIYPS